MSGGAFDVRAKRPPEVEDKPAWLVYCRRCSWHVEIERGCCWKGCPECGESLWLTLPDDGSSFRSPTGPERSMKADDYDKFFKPRRRKNGWRTAPFAVGRT